MNINQNKQNFFTKNTFMALLRGSQTCSGVIDIVLPPIRESDSSQTISGFLEEDLSLKLGHTWGSVLPDAQIANQIGQILGFQSQITWIQASASAWKATQPLEFDMTVYLVTLFRNEEPSVLDQAKEIMKMMALCVEGDDWATARIHGGYKVDYATSNSDLDLQYWTRDKEGKFNIDNKHGYSGDISKLGSAISRENPGTISIRINNKMTINNLLLNNVTVTHSAAYVDAITPLYVKLDLSFRSMRALLVSDIEKMY